jgi:hypothetical protein
MGVADIGQVLATGGTTIVAVSVGAGLTYWFGALNRRHQEARENRTRWYEARLQAYVEFQRVVYRLYFALEEGRPLPTVDREAFVQGLTDGFGALSFLASDEVTNTAATVYDLARRELAKETDLNVERVADALEVFEAVARKDLGHPSP